jgi:lysylphosphatidylglycerol synthetase-like protein (DUF2156 family)
MPHWRARWRRRLFSFPLPAIVGENPLEVGMIVWAGFTAVNLATGDAPSNSLRALPDGLELLWAAMMVLAGVTVALALWRRREMIVAGGMYLFAATLGAFAAAILGIAPWNRGGLTAGFLLIIGSVCFLRGWWLRDEEAQEIRALVRSRYRRG